MNWTPQTPEEKREKERRLKLASEGIWLPTEATSADVDKVVLRKELKSWSAGLAFWGIVSLGLAGLNSSWGIVLLVVSLGAWIFQDAALFVVFGVTLGWAAVSNIATLELFGVLSGLVQIVLTIQVFRKYRTYSTVRGHNISSDQEPDQETAGTISRAERFFPPLGCLFSALALAGAFAALVALIVVASRGVPLEPSGGIALAIDLVVDAAVLGLAVSLAALLSRFRWRGLSIAALIASGLMLLGLLVMIVVASVV